MNNIRNICFIDCKSTPNISKIFSKCFNTPKCLNMDDTRFICKNCHIMFCGYCISHNDVCIYCIHPELYQEDRKKCNLCNDNFICYLCFKCLKIIYRCYSFCNNNMKLELYFRDNIKRSCCENCYLNDNYLF